MPRFWTIVCYITACAAFALAFLDFTPVLQTRRRAYTIRAANWVALGLLAIALVTLVDVLNAP